MLEKKGRKGTGRACKPGSVLEARLRATVISLGGRLPVPSSGLPEGSAGIRRDPLDRAIPPA